MRPSDQLSLVFGALADPTRRAILTRLMAGETSAMQLGKPFAITASAVTKHLKVLESAGLITRSRHAQWRPCHLNAQPLQTVAAWMEPFRRFWDARLDGLAEYLRDVRAEDRV